MQNRMRPKADELISLAGRLIEYSLAYSDEGRRKGTFFQALIEGGPERWVPI
jgi:hypothetical protein